MSWRNPISHHDGGGKLRAVEQFAGTRVTVLEGDGASNPYREVVHYFDESGAHVSKHDPLSDAFQKARNDA